MIIALRFRPRWASLLFLLPLLCRPTVASSAVAGPIVRTAEGVVKGRLVDRMASFVGVPYAAAPIGPLRFAPPKAPTTWSGVRKATAFAPACLQKGVSMPGEPPPRTSEDCLYLNVWSGVGGRGPKPVIVFFPGGGFTNGATSLPLYAGDRLARRGVVVVTVAYRLGPLGFLALPELSKEAPDGASGDQGLLDQIAALEWVKRNVAAFGGDPSRVTIAGQSAGAMSVSLLMASPPAKGLFSRAIAQSGGVFEPLAIAPSWRAPAAEKQGLAYAASLGAKSLADLRALPAEKLLEGTASQVSHPVVGGGVLPVSPYEAFQNGSISAVPLLLGRNADEARSLVDPARVRAASFEADVSKVWGALPPALIAAYPHATDAEARRARLDFERDLRFAWDMRTWARLQAGTGQPAYLYRFDQAPPFPAGSVRAGWGASHFAELWYVFDHLDQERWRWSGSDRRLADQMARYWTNFAKTGDPNGSGLPSWPRFELPRVQHLVLGTPVERRELTTAPGLSAFDLVYGQLRAGR